MSMIPAFSPGPCTTSLLRVGSRFKCTRDDLYEQCSLHITLKIPSSVNDGSRPSDALIRSYSSGVMPCSAMTSGVITGCVVLAMDLRSPDPELVEGEGSLPPPGSLLTSKILLFLPRFKTPGPQAPSPAISKFLDHLIPRFNRRSRHPEPSPPKPSLIPCPLWRRRRIGSAASQV